MVRIAIVGFGKIARDQHVPSIAATPGIELVAIASPQGGIEGIACYQSLDALLAAEPGVDAVAICTPPQIRQRLAALALSAGRHVLLEKPPGATVSEVNGLIQAAQHGRKTLFTAWHSRFAPAVDRASALIAEHGALEATITWKEDVRVWHPGQDWIWQPGGLGVFDPGINALSILTRLIPDPLFVTEATLSYPSNRDAPIAAELTLGGLPARAAFDFRQTGPQSWDIAVETRAGALVLSRGGRQLTLDGRMVLDEPAAEYQGVYRRFVALIEAGASEVDTAPLALVADAFMLGRRVVVARFDE